MAFSLAELMIAVAILGLGLVMVATMFPVGWVRARDLSDYTTTQACVSAAETAVKQLCRVDGPKALVCPNLPCAINGPGSSFAGDNLINEPVPFVRDFEGRYYAFVPDPNPSTDGDTNVHALNLENLLANHAAATDNPSDRVPEDAWRIEGLRDFALDPVPPSGPVLGRYDYNDGAGTNYVLRLWYGLTQVNYEDRIHPVMPIRGTVPATTWASSLDNRRFSWGVLYRFNNHPGPTPPGPTYAQDDILSRTRQLTMYYSTLRRAQANHRFAQQDRPGAANASGGFVSTAPGTQATSVIQALPTDDDVVLPVPWLVPLSFIGSLDPSGNPTGLPGVAEIFAPVGSEPPIVPEMLPPGSWLIVRSTGNVYQVAEREIFDSAIGDKLARLTLDQELVTLPNPGPSPPYLQPDAGIQLVWIYPPRVEWQAGDVPSFLGPSPVAGLEVRNLTMTPD